MVSSSPTSPVPSIPPFSSKLALFLEQMSEEKEKTKQTKWDRTQQTDRQKMSQRKNTDRLTDTMFTHRNPIKNTKPERTYKAKRRKRRRKRKEKEPRQNIMR